MLGAFIFYNIITNLGESCRNKVLGNIFEISNVSVGDVVIRNDKIIFRIFSGDVYYQYIFDFIDNNYKFYVKVSCNNSSVDRIVLVSNYSDDFGIGLLFKIFNCCSERKVYQFMKKFL